VPWRDGLASRVHGVHRTFSSGSPLLGQPPLPAFMADDTPRSGPAAASILVKAASVSIGCTSRLPLARAASKAARHHGLATVADLNVLHGHHLLASRLVCGP
jgi:hypothetical protein